MRAGDKTKSGMDMVIMTKEMPTEMIKMKKEMSANMIIMKKEMLADMKETMPG
jgi:hypothetical protein